MRLSKSVFLWLVIVIIMAIMAFSMASYANDEDACDYHSYTTAIKSCDKYGSCLLQDFLVECCGSYISKVTATGNFMAVPRNHTDSALLLCE